MKMFSNILILSPFIVFLLSLALNSSNILWFYHLNLSPSLPIFCLSSLNSKYWIVFLSQEMTNHLIFAVISLMLAYCKTHNSCIWISNLFLVVLPIITDLSATSSSLTLQLSRPCKYLIYIDKSLCILS